MRAVFLFLLAAIAAVAVAWFIAMLPGSASIMVGSLTIEASTSVALVLVLVLFGLLYAAFRAFGVLIRLPRTLRRAQTRRMRARGDAAVTRALLALAAGDAAAARREAERARTGLHDAPIALLLAAQAGRMAQREGEAEAAYQALAARPEVAFLGLRGLLRQAVDRGDFAAAAALAGRAERAHPGAAWLREERLQLALHAGAWEDALRLAGPEQRAGLAVAAAQTATGERARELARAAWKADPLFAPAALAEAQALRASGKERAAQEVLRRAWAAASVPELAEFALAPVADKLARVTAAANFVRGAPPAEGELLLGRLALEAGLLGEARRHIDAAASLHQRRWFVLRADLADAEGDAEGARMALREAGGDDPGWRCTACGTAAPAWSPVCPACGAAGTLAWGLVQRHIPRLTHVQDVEALP